MMNGGERGLRNGEMWLVQNLDFEDIINLTSLQI